LTTGPAAAAGSRRGLERAHRNAAMKILIVEDETKAGDYLTQGLVEASRLQDLRMKNLITSLERRDPCVRYEQTLPPPI